ncbi:LPXTG cell wall anchor domain-containing protein [Streptomyces sp. NPDC014006]|uniref:LPXTG cell wall anchor domain-containing protein n=1 Tax=Streptomyces sp. NPDC014006 TaxID=3364870 RepID=UPI0036F85C29
MRLFPLAPVPAAAAATLLPLLPLPAHAATAVTAAAPAAHVLTAPAYAALAPDPACATDTGSSGFPLRARIRGGPAVYDAGGGYGVWYLDLTNTTHGTCTAVHPVVVLVDERRALTAAQPRLEFDDGARTRSVRFETTDEDELVGAFGETDGFGGFSVGPRRTLTVRVRLAFTADAVPNEVTAEAAVVRRHDDDGDWVGQSNDYRFAVHNPSGPAPQQDPATDPGATPPGPARTPATPDPTPDPTPAPTPAPTGALAIDELARTGIADGALGAAVALLLGGAALLVLRRRR